MNKLYIYIVSTNSTLDFYQLQYNRGAFGTVFLGKWRGSYVAVKVLFDGHDQNKSNIEEKAIQDFLQEAAIMRYVYQPIYECFSI